MRACSGTPGSAARGTGGLANAASYSRRALPVCELACFATSAGVPVHTIAPPASPPSGPRSINQSAARITSRLCSITTSECPASINWRKAESSFATSSKCRPVVGSSNKNSDPRTPFGFEDASTRWPASFSRCASPPESVGTGWPTRTYSRPTSASGFNARCTSEWSRKKASASDTVSSSTSAIDFLPTTTSSTSSRKRLPLQSGQRRYTSERNCISTCSKPLPPQPAEPARRFGRLAFRLSKRGVEHVLHQRGFPRARDAGDAHQALERNADVDVLQVVLGGAEELDLRRLPVRRRGCPAAAGTPSSGEIFRRERFRLLQLVGRAEENDLAAAFARPRAHVHDAVGLQHDLRIVLDHNERVAGVAQALHHADHATHVARVQADRGFVQHEERIDERSAERRGEVDALHLSARERARLAVEREIAEADVVDVAQPGADFGEKQIGGLVQRGGEMQLLEERARALGG